MDLNLPQRIYVLTYDLDKNRFDQLTYRYRGQLLRAAALTELTLAGLVRDDHGKIIRTGGEPPADPFLAEVLADVPSESPRGRQGVLHRRITKAEPVVRDQLAAAGVITVRRKKTLGVFTTHTVTFTRPEQVRELRERVRTALFTGGDPAAVPRADAAAAAIAAAGDIMTVFTFAEQKRYKDQLKALTAHFEELVPGMHKAIRLAVAASRTAAA